MIPFYVIYYRYMYIFMYIYNRVINYNLYRKREAEMAKLRKLLEDVHSDSEQQIHMLR